MSNVYVQIDGKDCGDLKLFALSTCIWCKRLKTYLDEKGVKYNYVFIDQLEGTSRDTVKEELRKWNSACSFPTLVINSTSCVIGFDEEAIDKELANAKK